MRAPVVECGEPVDTGDRAVTEPRVQSLGQSLRRYADLEGQHRGALLLELLDQRGADPPSSSMTTTRAS